MSPRLSCIRSLVISGLILGIQGLAAGPVFAGGYPPGSGDVTLADLIPRPDALENDGEGYKEQYSVSFKLKDGASSYLQLVITNLGMGDGHLALAWELGLPDGSRLRSKQTAERKGWKTARDRFDVRMGKSRWRGEPGRLVVEVDDKGYAARYVITNRVAAWKPGQGRVDLGSGRYYAFQLLAPMARVRMTGTRPDGSSFQGSGWAYVDHSVTNVSAERLASRWARFRSFSGRQAIHFVEFFPPAHDPVGFVLVASPKDGVIFSSLSAHGSYQDFWTDGDHKNRYRVPRKVRFEIAGDDHLLRLVVQGSRMVWREDYLASLGSLARMVVQKFAQPIGYGYDGKARGIIRRPDGSTLPVLGTGRYIVTHIAAP